MKKYISLVLIILLILSGCGKKENTSNNTENTTKFEIKEDSYFLYQNESTKKEIFLSKDGTIVIANCEYTCDLEKGTYTIKDNKLSTNTTKYDNNMCTVNNDNINKEYEIKEDYLILNNESYTKVDKTEVSDVDYYKDINCNNNKQHETVKPSTPREN